jgi:polyhydroxyalkanoate synthase subunit PhaC
LIIPAPIKRPYIWDLTPRTSVVRRLVASGARVYLMAWTDPGHAEQEFGLAEYADRLVLACLDAIRTETGAEHAILAGHSLGGTLAAIFAALHPERVRGLVLLETPLRFGANAGAFAPLLAAAPPAGALRAAFGNVPGTFLNLVSATASPTTFQWSRWLDGLASLGDPQALDTHIRVERWSLDEFPLPGRLFEETVELLYRGDRFMAGTLVVGGRPARPERVEAPLLCVFDPRSRIVPPGSVLPFHEAVTSYNKRLLRYEGDTGVALQHVGVLVGRNAHRTLWPEILRWVERIDGPRAAARRR